MSLFEKVIDYGIENCDESLSCLGKVFVAQSLKAIPVGLAVFLILLIFCPLGLAVSIGIAILPVMGVCGLSALD